MIGWFIHFEIYENFKDVNRDKITLFQGTIIQSDIQTNIIRPNQQNTYLLLPNDSEYSHWLRAYYIKNTSF